MKYTLIVFQ